MKKRILTNISFNFLIRVTTYLFSFLTLIYITRVLQPDTFGKISFLSSFSSYFVMLASLGMPIYAMRACAEKRESRQELSLVFGELWSINIVLSAVSIALLALFVVFTPKLWENRMLLAIYGSAVIFQMLGCEWLFKGLEKFGLLAEAGAICKAASLLAIIIFIHDREQVVSYAALSVVATYGSSIVCFFAIHRYVDFPSRLFINKKHLKPLFIFFMMSCAVSIYSSLDLTMLGFLKSDYETGLYSIASKGKGVLAVTGGLVWSAILPTATKLWKDGEKERFESLAIKSLMGVCTVQTVVAVICIIFARYLILFAGGESYLGAINAFRILLLSLIPIGASNILGGQVLIPAGKEQLLLRAEIAGALFNFFANLLLIPYLAIIGAAITTLISEIIVWGMCVYYAKSVLGMDFLVGPFARTFGWMGRKEEVFAARILSQIRKDELPYYCPCCDTYLMHFIDAGFRKHPESYNRLRYERSDQQVICPVCRSLPRHRILVSYLNENMELVRKKKILHFAQERSLRMWMDRNEIKSITADLFSTADLKLDVQDTGLESESFDVIIINHVIEHVDDYRRALHELHRILCQGGHLIISFPVDLSFDTVYEDARVCSKESRVEHFGQYDHLRIFGRDSEEILESYGFKVSDIRGETYSSRIKPVIGPADYDYNVLWCLEKK